MSYDWALNKFKLDRAIKQVGTSDEKALQEAYIALGGLFKKELALGLSDAELAEEIKTGVNIDANGEPLSDIRELVDEVLASDEEKGVTAYDGSDIPVAPKKKRGRPKKL